MGSKFSKSSKGEKKWDDLKVNGKSLPENFDKTSTLPASFRRRDEEVVMTGTLPRNLSRNQSFSKRFRKSCKNWAAQKGLIDPCKAEETETQSQVPTKPSSVVLAQEECKDKINDVQELPEVVITKAQSLDALVEKHDVQMESESAEDSVKADPEAKCENEALPTSAEAEIEIETPFTELVKSEALKEEALNSVIITTSKEETPCDSAKVSAENIMEINCIKEEQVIVETENITECIENIIESQITDKEEISETKAFLENIENKANNDIMEYEKEQVIEVKEHTENIVESDISEKEKTSEPNIILENTKLETNTNILNNEKEQVFEIENKEEFNQPKEQTQNNIEFTEDEETSEPILESTQTLNIEQVLVEEIERKESFTQPKEQTETIIESEITVVEDTSELILESTQTIDNEIVQVEDIESKEPFTQQKEQAQTNIESEITEEEETLEPILESTQTLNIEKVHVDEIESKEPFTHPKEQTETIIESEISVVEEASEPNIILNSTQVLDNEKEQVVEIARNEPFTQDNVIEQKSETCEEIEQEMNDTSEMSENLTNIANQEELITTEVSSEDNEITEELNVVESKIDSNEANEEVISSIIGTIETNDVVEVVKIPEISSDNVEEQIAEKEEAIQDGELAEDIKSETTNDEDKNILHVNTEESNEEETSFNGSCEEREEVEIKEIFPENTNDSEKQINLNEDVLLDSYTIDSEKLVEEVQTEVEANIGSCIEDESNVETEKELVKGDIVLANQTVEENQQEDKENISQISSLLSQSDDIWKYQWDNPCLNPTKIEQTADSTEETAEIHDEAHTDVNNDELSSQEESIQSVVEVNTECLELENTEEVETEIEPETMKNELEILECDNSTNVEVESNISLPELEEVEIIYNEQKEISDDAEPSSLESLEEEKVDEVTAVSDDNKNMEIAMKDILTDIVENIATKIEITSPENACDSPTDDLASEGGSDCVSTDEGIAASDDDDKDSCVSDELKKDNAKEIAESEIKIENLITEIDQHT